MRRTIFSAVGTVAVVGAVAIGMSLAGGGATPAGADTVLEQVRSELMRSYYRPVPANVLREPSVSAMLGALRDPYTEYLEPTKLRLLRLETRSSYSGAGGVRAESPMMMRSSSPGSGPRAISLARRS